MTVVVHIQHLERRPSHFLEVGGEVQRRGVTRPDVGPNERAERVLPAGGARIQEHSAAWFEETPVLGQGGPIVGEVLGYAEVHDRVVWFIGRVLQEVLQEHPAGELLALDRKSTRL